MSVSIDAFFKTANRSFPYILESVLQMDSRSIMKNDRKILLEKVKSSSHDKILIIHGTYTLTEIARFISESKLNKTIFLVGSFLSGSYLITAARFNLGYAISSLQFLKPDMFIAMNRTIFHWKNVTKNLETNQFERKDE